MPTSEPKPDPEPTFARDGGFVVSVVLSGLGFNNSCSVDQSETRPILYELSFYDFGTTTELMPPAGCDPNA